MNYHEFTVQIYNLGDRDAKDLTNHIKNLLKSYLGGNVVFSPLWKINKDVISDD